MDFAEAMTKRRMVRRFSPEPIADEVLEQILHAVRFAPSAGFTQGVELLVLCSPDERRKFWELASDASWRSSGTDAADLIAAPTIIVPVVDAGAYLARYGKPDKARSGLAGRPQTQWPVPYWLIDASFVTMLLLLAATNAGLGALFFRLHSDEQTVLEGLGIPPDRSTIGALAIGRRKEPPGALPARRDQRAYDDLVHRDRW